MKKFKFLAFMLAMFAGVCFFASCSDDDDEETEGNSLKGTSWIITQSDFAEEIVGAQVTFNSDGNLKFNPSNEWTYAKWEQNDSRLKIIIGEGEPDDYMDGNLVVNGNTATYTYKWYDYNGEWSGVDTYTIKLQRK